MSYSKFLPIGLSAALLMSLVACDNSESVRPVHWSYDGHDGPPEWGRLSPAYSLCAEGHHQSPIDIRRASVDSLVVWNPDYEITSLHIAHTQHVEDLLDNGHTIQVTVIEGSSVRVGSKTYSLAQFHFHTPSEHTLNGENLPMEMHLVHSSDDGSLAVVAVLFTQDGQPNEILSKIVANLPDAKGESNHVEDVDLSLGTNIPLDGSAYHYSGSLTTPPCSEGVEWLVLEAPVMVSADQIQAIASRIGPNNRPTQPLNDRAVMEAALRDSEAR